MDGRVNRQRHKEPKQQNLEKSTVGLKTTENGSRQREDREGRKTAWRRLRQSENRGWEATGKVSLESRWRNGQHRCENIQPAAGQSAAQRNLKKVCGEVTEVGQSERRRCPNIQMRRSRRKNWEGDAAGAGGGMKAAALDLVHSAAHGENSRR